MAGIRTKNTFEGGLTTDSDKQKLQPNQYLDSINGSLLYNDQGSISWENIEGNRLNVTITPRNGTDNAVNYVVIGDCHFPRFSFIFLVDPVGNNSEIGIFNIKEDGTGQYKTMFNDQDDPNGEKLNFKATNQIKAKQLKENEKLLRAYWVDGVASDSNPPRVFTIEYDDSLDPNDINSYTPVTDSVHSINVQADINFGIIKFIEYIPGNIKTGAYKFTYRLRTDDGYASPWSPLTGRYDVTSDAISNTNWNEYEMEGSGQDTNKGMKLEIKGIDERYDIIQVAFVHYETAEVVADAQIFTTFQITSDIHEVNFIANGGVPLNTDDISATYVVIDAAKTIEFKDATKYDGNIREGNLSFTKEQIDTVLENLVVVPKIKDMQSDQKNNYGIVPPDPNNNDSPNAFTEWTPPITHQNPTAFGQIQRPVHSGLTETYEINNDYLNYKGTQVSHMFKGYFRGETYRFGIVFYDKKGFPGFAYHLCDFTFPDQYDTAYSWIRLKADDTTQSDSGNTTDPLWVTNDFNHLVGDKVSLVQSPIGHNYSELRILGLEFGGIDISSIKDEISMVKIVRVKRDPQIVYQGLNVPLIVERNNVSGQVISPMISCEHSWRNTDSIVSDLDGALATDADPLKYVQESAREFWDPTKYVNLWRPDNNEPDEEPASVMFSPDIDFDVQRIPTIQTGDALKVVGSCFTYGRYVANQGTKDMMAYYQYAFGVNNSDGGKPDVKNLSTETMLKLYFSDNDYHDASNSPSAIYPRYGEKASITGGTSFTSTDELGGFQDGFMSNYILYNEIQSYRDRAGGWDVGVADRFQKSMVKPYAFYYRHSFYTGQGSTNAFAPILRHNKVEADYSFAAGIYSPFTLTQTNAYGYLIVNYYRENQALYGGLNFSALEQNIFLDTGYTCTVGNPTFADPTNDIINDAEVWGGDCYLDFVGMQLMYNRYWLREDGGTPGGYGNTGIDPDINNKTTQSLGLVFPLESEINHAMRNAPSESNPIYSDNGARPFAVDEYGTAASFKARAWEKGLFYASGENKLLEEWNYNGVLLLESFLKTFKHQTLFFQEDLINFPIRWRYTQIKIYGDPIDTWRIYQANDFDDLNGEYGDITSSFFLFNQIYSLQEQAFGKLRAYNRTAVVTPDQGNLTTGIGDALDGVDYISKEYGNQHQWSLTNTDKAAYWVDIDRQKIMRFAQDGVAPISDFRSMHQFPKKLAKDFISKDNPAYTEGISSIFDYSNNRVIFTFMKNKFTSIGQNTTYTDSNIDLNETLFLKVEVPALVLTLNTTKTIFYICLEDQENINLTINGTSFGLLSAGTCYRVIGQNDVYSVEVVDESVITPYRYSLVYHEDMNVFVHYYSNKARYWLNFNAYLISAGFDALGGTTNKNTLWLHEYGSAYGSYYGQIHKSLLKINVNENGDMHKIFDSLRVNTNREDLFSYFVYNTDTQNYWINLNTFPQSAYKEDILRYPIRWTSQLDRTRGKFASMSWDIDNNTNAKTRISSIATNYRLSNRI